MPRERPGRDEDDQGPKDQREREGPNPMVIIGVVAVVVILVIVVGFFAFSGSNIDSISVDNPVETSDGISFGITTTSGNLGQWSGTVAIEIFFEGRTDPVYTGKADVSDDSGSHSVAWSEFIWGNGNYEVHAKAGGLDEYSSMNIRRVVTELEVEWNGEPVLPRSEPGHSIEVSVSYSFSGQEIPRSEFPSGYDLDLIISPPSGSDITIESTGNKYKHVERIEHNTAGQYEISGTLVNTFCHPSSPHKTLTITGNTTFEYDAHPFAVLDGDATASLSGGEAIVNLDAGDSWDDGTIVEYEWDFGDGTTEITSTPTVQHIYTDTGTYTVTINIIDDQDQESDNQTGLYDLHAVTIV